MHVVLPFSRIQDFDEPPVLAPSIYLRIPQNEVPGCKTFDPKPSTQSDFALRAVDYSLGYTCGRNYHSVATDVHKT
jgi:hypothetical protein